MFGAGRGVDDVKKRIKKVKVNLGMLPKEALEEDRYNLIGTPDAQLTQDQIKQKKIQIIQKAAAETRLQKKLKEKEKR